MSEKHTSREQHNGRNGRQRITKRNRSFCWYYRRTLDGLMFKKTTVRVDRNKRPWRTGRISHAKGARGERPRRSECVSRMRLRGSCEDIEREARDRGRCGIAAKRSSGESGWRGAIIQPSCRRDTRLPSHRRSLCCFRWTVAAPDIFPR